MTYSFYPTEGEDACLHLIRKHESNEQYNILCGGERFHSYARFPIWRGYKGSHAAGAYQFEPGTWAWVSEHTGVKDFTPASQDINALWLLRKVGPNSSESWEASGPYPAPVELNGGKDLSEATKRPNS